MKKSFLATCKSNHVCFSISVLICTALFVVNTGIQVSDLTNVALNKPTDQGPGTFVDLGITQDPLFFQSSNAVDGGDSTSWFFCANTKNNNPNWWLVDLQATYQIRKVDLLNREDMFYPRLQNFTVDIFEQDPRSLPGFPDTSGKICMHHKGVVGESQWAELNCNPGALTGRFVRVIKWGFEHLTLCEVQVFGCRVPSKTSFNRFPSKAAEMEGKQLLGVFDNPAQCSMEMIQSPFDAFEFNHQDGRCQGYQNSQDLSRTDSNQWDTYIEA